MSTPQHEEGILPGARQIAGTHAGTGARHGCGAAGKSSACAEPGFSMVELALVLVVLVPLMLAALGAAQKMLRSWQVHETASAAVRYVADVDPAALIDAQQIDQELSARCARLAAQLSSHPAGIRIAHCGRINAHTVQVELGIPALALAPAVSTTLQWRLHVPL